MFYIKSFMHKLSLHPQYIGQNIQSLIQEYLYKKVEGICTSSGYIIAVLKIEKISEGKILLSGQISFQIEYQALVLKPNNGEVVDAQIISCTKMGFFANVGPLSIFIYNYQVPQNLFGSLTNGTQVRLRIIGTKINSSKVYAIGSLSDDALGIIS